MNAPCVVKLHEQILTFRQNFVLLNWCSILVIVMLAITIHTTFCNEIRFILIIQSWFTELSPKFTNEM